MTNNEVNEEIKIDDKVINRIVRRIMIEETKNIKSQDKNDQQMVKVIKNLIEEEVECY